MCRTWNQVLSRPGPLWQAADLSECCRGYVQMTPAALFSLQRWFQRHGAGLRQLQTNTEILVKVIRYYHNLCFLVA